jgi:hypothetical protein
MREKLEDCTKFMFTLGDVAHKAIEVSLDKKSGETADSGWDHIIDLLSHLA